MRGQPGRRSSLPATARKLPSDPTPRYRAAPHNIEAEQALLGAILVNNEAFYRVSDFLEPGHFFEPLHQKIFELSGSLIRAVLVYVGDHDARAIADQGGRDGATDSLGSAGHDGNAALEQHATLPRT